MSNYAVRALTFNYPTARTYDFVFTFTCDKKVAANSHEVFVEKCEIGDFAVFFFSSLWFHASHLDHMNHTETTQEKKLRNFIQGSGGFPPACLALSKRDVQVSRTVERKRLLKTPPCFLGHLT